MNSSAETHLMVFLGQNSLKIKVFPTVTLAKQIKREERFVLTLNFRGNKKNWAFSDYQGSNATQSSIIFWSKSPSKKYLVEIAKLKQEIKSTLRQECETEYCKKIKTNSSPLAFSN